MRFLPFKGASPWHPSLSSCNSVSLRWGLLKQGRFLLSRRVSPPSLRGLRTGEVVPLVYCEAKLWPRGLCSGVCQHKCQVLRQEATVACGIFSQLLALLYHDALEHIRGGRSLLQRARLALRLGAPRALPRQGGFSRFRCLRCLGMLGLCHLRGRLERVHPPYRLHSSILERAPA